MPNGGIQFLPLGNLEVVVSLSPLLLSISLLYNNFTLLSYARQERLNKKKKKAFWDSKEQMSGDTLWSKKFESRVSFSILSQRMWTFICTDTCMLCYICIRSTTISKVIQYFLFHIFVSYICLFGVQEEGKR